MIFQENAAPQCGNTGIAKTIVFVWILWDIIIDIFLKIWFTPLSPGANQINKDIHWTNPSCPPKIF